MGSNVGELVVSSSVAGPSVGLLAIEALVGLLVGLSPSVSKLIRAPAGLSVGAPAGMGTLLGLLVGDIVLRTTEFRLIKTFPPGLVAGGALVGVGTLLVGAVGLPLELSRLIRTLPAVFGAFVGTVGEAPIGNPRTPPFVSRLIRTLFGPFGPPRTETPDGFM